MLIVMKNSEKFSSNPVQILLLCADVVVVSDDVEVEKLRSF